jgi:hypothetical protein
MIQAVTYETNKVGKSQDNATLENWMNDDETRTERLTALTGILTRTGMACRMQGNVCGGVKDYDGYGVIT